MPATAPWMANEGRFGASSPPKHPIIITAPTTNSTPIMGSRLIDRSCMIGRLRTQTDLPRHWCLSTRAAPQLRPQASIHFSLVIYSLPSRDGRPLCGFDLRNRHLQCRHCSQRRYRTQHLVFLQFWRRCWCSGSGFCPGRATAASKCGWTRKGSTTLTFACKHVHLTFETLGGHFYTHTQGWWTFYGSSHTCSTATERSGLVDKTKPFARLSALPARPPTTDH